MKNWNYKNFTIHQFEELESTNKTAFELANLNKIFDHEIILAISQTSGKGRQKRSWSSPEGNLYFSLLLRPKVSSQKISQISFIGIVALKSAIEKITKNVTVKWPNDLLIDNKKCAGLLLESKLNQKETEFVILGIGLNIESSPDNTIFPATNLKSLGIEISPKEALEIFLDEFEKIYQNWLSFGFAGVRKLWLKDAWHLKEEIAVKVDNKEISGIFEDLDEDGNLLLRCDEKLITVFAADIFA